MSKGIKIPKKLQEEVPDQAAYVGRQIKSCKDGLDLRRKYLVEAEAKIVEFTARRETLVAEISKFETELAVLTERQQRIQAVPPAERDTKRQIALLQAMIDKIKAKESKPQSIEPVQTHESVQPVASQ